MRYTLPDLLPGTVYAIQVRSIAGANVSEWSRTFTVTTIQDTRRPDEPQNVTWISSGDSFHGEWDSVLYNEEGTTTKIDRYEVELVANGVTKYASVAPQEAGGRVTFDLSFEANRALFGLARPTIAMRVRAINSNRVSSLWTTAITAQNPPPGPPTNFVANGISDAIEFSWTAPTDLDLHEQNPYRIFVGASADFTPSNANNIYAGAGNRAVYGSTTYTTQYFKIRSVDKFGQESSDASASAKPNSPFVVDVNPPNNATNLVVTPGFDVARQVAYLDATWTASTSTDVQNYVIRYSIDNTNWQYISVPGDVTAARLDNLMPGTDYYVGIRAVDFVANESAWASIPKVTTTNDTVAPSTPAAPTASSSTQRISVVHSGTNASGGAMETDVAFYKVFAATASNFTPSSSNMLGTIRNSPAIVETFSIPATSTTANATTQTWYVRVTAVDRAGNESPASVQATANPGLIDSSFIVDAAITNAKISNLDVNKLTAGTGLATDFTIKSKLTLGESGAVGAIQSYDYLANGSTGFRLASDGLVIKSGSIEAPALKIQTGINQIPPEYADFEFVPAFYAGGTYGGTVYTPAVTTSQSNLTVGVGSDVPRTGTQYLRLTTIGSVTAPDIYFGASANDANTYLESGKTYILSFYARNPTTNAVSVSATMRWNNGTTTSVIALTPLPTGQATAWARYSGTFTVPSGLSVGMLKFGTNASVPGIEIDIDGMQIEEQIAALSTPSTWKPSTSTIIDGSRIRTGAIISNQNITIGSDTFPLWSIPVNGSATFANLLVRGNTVVGSVNDGVNTTLSSANYLPGTTGWQFRSDGTADLLGLQAGSISGASVSVGTLRPSALGDSEDNDPLNAVINLEGALVATGDMGEIVSMSGDGFTAIGPHETAVSSRAMTSGGQATLVTGENHGYAVGSTIYVSDVGDQWDGEQTISAVPAANQIQYNIVGTATAVTTTSSLGMVQGKDMTGTRSQPVNVDFPTNGAKPNIISGKTTASALIVTNTAQFDNLAILNSGATMVITSGVAAPRTTPTVNWSWPSLQFSGWPGSSIKGITKGHNNNIFILSSTGQIVYISEHSPTTGARLSTVYTGTMPSTSTSSAALLNGLVYQNNFYYYSSQTGGYLGSTCTVNVTTLNSTWTTVGNTSLLSSTTYYYGAAIGRDYANARLMFAWVSGNTVAARSYSVLANGQPSVSTISTVSVSSSYSMSDVGFITRGPMGPSAADRIIIKAKTYNSTTYRKNYIPLNTSGSAYTSEIFQAADTSSIVGGYYDDTTGDIYDLSSQGTRRQYRGGDSITPGKTWVAYSLRNDAGTLETNISPRTSVTQPNRSTLNVTIPSIPIGLGRSNDPRKANIWLSRSYYDPGATSTSWKLRGTITYPSSSTNIDPYQTPGAQTVKSANQFLTETGGQAGIKTSSGKSYWNGDDNAQFYGLIIWGGADVDFAAGNKPPLRIRDAGNTTEMRIDGNELASVNMGLLDSNGNTLSVTPAPLALQREAGDVVIGGTTTTGTFLVRKPMETYGTVKFGGNGRAFVQKRMGVVTKATGVDGQTSIAHGGSTAPDVVMCTPQADGSDGWVMVGTINASTFTVTLKGGADNGLLATTKTFHWEATWF